MKTLFTRENLIKSAFLVGAFFATSQFRISALNEKLTDFDNNGTKYSQNQTKKAADELVELKKILAMLLERSERQSHQLDRIEDRLDNFVSQK